MMNSVIKRIALFALLACGIAQAQNEQPAITTPTDAGAKAAQNAAAEPEIGMSLIGERESPIGLYLMPWRDAAAEADMDRPARLMRVELTPVEREVFVRQVEYYAKLTEHQAASTPAADLKPVAP